MNQQPNPAAESPDDREAKYGEFVGLLARNDHSIRRFVRSLLPLADGVDDVMQETALECWRKFESFSPSNDENAIQEFTRWACVIARYKVLSWQRDHARDRLVFRDGVIECLAESTIQELESKAGERVAIEQCLSQLSADHRRLVLSVHLPGESIAKIAKESGVNARRLYTRVNAIRRQLLDCVHSQMTNEAS